MHHVTSVCSLGVTYSLSQQTPLDLQPRLQNFFLSEILQFNSTYFVFAHKFRSWEFQEFRSLFVWTGLGAYKGKDKTTK